MSTGIGGEVLWWCPSLDTAGNGTTTLTDLSSSGYNGTLTNMDAATDWVADTGSGGVRALDFDGSNDYVTGLSTAVQSLSVASVSFWVKTTTEARLGFSIYEQNGINNGLFIGLGQNISGAFTNELITFVRVVSGTATNQVAYTTATRTEVFDGNWHHVCMIFNSAYTLYLDGTSKSLSFSGSDNGAFSSGITGLNRVTIAARDVSASRVPLLGRMDDVRVFDRAISASEITALASKRGYEPPTGRARRLINDGLFNRGLFNTGLMR